MRTAFVLRPEPESQICCFNICETGKQNMKRRFTALNGSPSCLALIRNSGEVFPSRAEQNNSPSHNAPLYSRRRGRIHRSSSAAEQTYSTAVALSSFSSLFLLSLSFQCSFLLLAKRNLLSLCIF